ncbi:hypothetical protein CIAN88_04275 [[Clostridium] innocuum]|uniref:Uncharacterized protein n=1 Tax=Clostridium innocuum TaxID=1522 RepID=A0A099IB29_CLOIN|nr:hypothetical protein CIAN88_04275 [[Clostridium] innocuum]
MKQRISAVYPDARDFPRFFHKNTYHSFPPYVETVEKLLISFIYHTFHVYTMMEKHLLISIVFHFSTKYRIPHFLFPHFFHMESCGKWRNSFIYPVLSMFSCG